MEKVGSALEQRDFILEGGVPLSELGKSRKRMAAVINKATFVMTRQASDDQTPRGYRGRRNGLGEKAFWFLFRKRLYPGLDSFTKSGTLCFEPGEVVEQLSVHDVQQSTSLIAREYDEIRNEVEMRYTEVPTHYQRNLAIGRKSSLLIYQLVRLTRPAVIVETGVANGESSYFLLKALSNNNHGILHSIDISSDVGDLLEAKDKTRWRLEVLDAHRTHESFEKVIDQIGQVDLFIHDSGNHNYSLQMFEYTAVLRKMAPHSLLASDDVDDSYAFLDFCNALRARPVFLLERGGCFGVLRLP